MNIGDYVRTPRFCTVRIAEKFESEKEARDNGFKEPTHYENSDFGIYGKSIGVNRMIFACFKINSVK